ncbi:MAG: hypothetical protein RX318_00420 [bacterium]|nr:hypothetical protein [bacterium]
MRELLEDEWETYNSWLTQWPEGIAQIEAAGFTRRRLLTDWLYCYGEFCRDGGTC